MIQGYYALLPCPRLYPRIVKVGRASDVVRRVKWHRWRWPELHVVAHWYTIVDDPDRIEKMLHDWIIATDQGFKVDLVGSNETFCLRNVYTFMLEFNKLDVWKLVEVTSNARRSSLVIRNSEVHR